MSSSTSSTTPNNTGALVHLTSTTGHVVITAGPPCHIDECSVRSALAQGVLTLVLENVRELLNAGVVLFTVADEPLPSTIGRIEISSCTSCGEPAIASVQGTPWAADVERLRQVGFAA